MQRNSELHKCNCLQVQNKFSAISLAGAKNPLTNLYQLLFCFSVFMHVSFKKQGGEMQQVTTKQL